MYFWQYEGSSINGQPVSIIVTSLPPRTSDDFAPTLARSSNYFNNTTTARLHDNIIITTEVHRDTRPSVCLEKYAFIRGGRRTRKGAVSADRNIIYAFSGIPPPQTGAAQKFAAEIRTRNIII